MMLLSADRLAQHLFETAGVLRGSSDFPSLLGITSGLLVLKWASDQNTLEVPEEARWQHVVEVTRSSPSPGDTLNKALARLEESNPVALDGVLSYVDFSKGLKANELRSLIDRFDQISMAVNDLEFDDVVGHAYNRFVGWFTEATGKQGGESHTPRSVIELMVRLARPLPGHAIYDPFSGSADMLTVARDYVIEHDRRAAGIRLFGQERNEFNWVIARLNLLLHSVNDGSVHHGDSLTDPQHVDAGGRMMLFDRILTNPPFSANYVRAEMRYPERMRYGWTSEQGKKADLMNIQHVLASLKADGLGAVVSPHGVLFRGGAEAGIRRGIVADGRLEAVIGIGPNVFHGTGIPACILILRGENGPADVRRGSVLFINAEYETATGRTRNHLEARHIEKIVQTYRTWSDSPGFSRVVTITEIAQNEFNLNIRRYVDASQANEPVLDVRTIVFGGLPRQAIDTVAPKFAAFGIELADLLHSKADAGFSVLPEGHETTVKRIQLLASTKEQLLRRCYDGWSERTRQQLADLAGTQQLLRSRSNLIASFCDQLEEPGILDRSQLAGVFADWWSGRKEDLRSLDLYGFKDMPHRTAPSAATQLRSPATPDEVIAAFDEDLRLRLEGLVASERHKLVETYQLWVEKYSTSLTELKKQSEVAIDRLTSRLEQLGLA